MCVSCVYIYLMTLAEVKIENSRTHMHTHTYIYIHERASTYHMCTVYLYLEMSMYFLLNSYISISCLCCHHANSFAIPSYLFVFPLYKHICMLRFKKIKCALLFFSPLNKSLTLIHNEFVATCAIVYYKREIKFYYNCLLILTHSTSPYNVIKSIAPDF